MIVVPLKNAAGAVESIDMTMSLWGRDTKTFKLKTTVTQFGKLYEARSLSLSNAPHRRVVESLHPSWLSLRLNQELESRRAGTGVDLVLMRLIIECHAL